MPVETLGVYIGDAIIDIAPFVVFEPQVDTRDPFRVLSEYRLQILAGDYSHTLTEIGEAAHVPPSILASALLRRLAEAARFTQGAKAA